MEYRIRVECVVWHDSAKKEDIINAVGINPRIAWSIGDILTKGAIPKDRTYCRFDLGNFYQEELLCGLKMLYPFTKLPITPILQGWSIITYLTNLDDAPEIHVDLSGLTMLKLIHSSIVYR